MKGEAGRRGLKAISLPPPRAHLSKNQQLVSKFKNPNLKIDFSFNSKPSMIYDI